ncbi:MAG: alpha/beta hydrolase [Microbacterium sp.]
MTRSHRTEEVPVAGGSLRVGVWDAAGETAPPTATIVAVHGITASHLAWQWLADALPEVRIVAPDLRGRGRSNAVAGPAGMAAHADDLAAVFAHLRLPRALVVGHSMGAFVSVVFAARHSALVARLVLLDGGLPLQVPAGLSGDALVAAVLGPTAERLSMTFASEDEYFAFWRRHPGLADAWGRELERYLAYDLVPAGAGLLCPATSLATTTEDTVDLNTTAVVPEALRRVTAPRVLVSVSRGLQNEEPGLYAPEHLARQLALFPGFEAHRWDGFNHYTVVMTPAGASRVADLVREQLAR